MPFGRRERYWNVQKIQSSIFFYIDVERLERDSKIYEQYYYKSAYICGLCGEIIDIWGRSGANQHMAEYHAEWIDSFILSEYENYKVKMIHHIDSKICELSNLYDSLISLELEGIKDFLKEKRNEKQKSRRRVFLKPWKDPESLFCDRKFLEELLGKEVAYGEECKD